MKRTKTFIIGAGASSEFGLPTGAKLVEQIEEICRFKFDDFGRITSGNRTMRSAFSVLKRSDGRRWEAAYLAEVAEKLRQNMGLAPSIDNFLAAHSDKEGWAAVGKLAIAKAILDSEYETNLWFDPSNSYNRPDFASLEANWLTELFRILVAGRDLNTFKLALQSCRFVTFNYDRVIEQFFHYSIASYFDLNGADADEICRSYLNVVHVYGSLGPVSFSEKRFGETEDPEYLVEAASRIKTFGEGTSSDADVQNARDWIESADALLILGFSYLPLNLRVLAPELGALSSSVNFWTAKGVSPNNLRIAEEIISNEWYEGFNEPIEFSHSTASELIWQNSFYLSEADI